MSFYAKLPLHLLPLASERAPKKRKYLTEVNFVAQQTLYGRDLHAVVFTTANTACMMYQIRVQATSFFEEYTLCCSTKYIIQCGK